MCGIVGIVDRRGVAQSTLRGMTDLIVHRGPDDEGFQIDDGAGLAMRRLSIIDLAGGHQPIGNEDGSVVVIHNGEIYNYRELVADLTSRGHRFSTQSDSEVIVHAYEEFGLECLERIWGMFALAIWDRSRRRLLLARDRLGKKPLYWAGRDERLAFASELKCLRTLDWIDTDPDPSSLRTYLTIGFIPAPGTIFRGVKKLRAGEALLWEEGRVRTWTYWDIPHRRTTVRSRGEAVDAVRELLVDSVRRRLQSDVAVGALLSSGIDSSTIVGVMATQAASVDTFTIGFPDREMDESAEARELAGRLGTRHHELVVESSVAEIAPRLAWHLDEPFADGAAIPTFLIAEVARRHVKVLLTGEGGDEAFGGYRYYRWEVLARRYRRLANALGRGWVDALARRAARASGSWKALFFLESALNEDATSVANWQRLAVPDGGVPLVHRELRSAVASASPLDAYVEAYVRRADRDLLNRLMYVDAKVFLPDDLLMKVDRTTMAHSLEARTPFLDHRLIELLASLPSDYKIDKHAMTTEALAALPFGRHVPWRDRTKPLLRSVASTWLPDDVCRRPKRVFATPLDRWLRNDLLPLTRDVIESSAHRGSGMLDPGALRELHGRFLNGETRLARLLWAVLMLELWAHAWRPTVRGVRA
jgi:asparagine synthase (glutamine-hydrolysing)